MYEWGLQKLLGDTKARASCVHPGPSYVKCGISVSLGWGTLVEAVWTQREAVLPLQQ